MPVILSETTATVGTFAELKEVLEDTTGSYQNITTVYLTNHIAHGTSAITIPLSKPNVVIDGTYDEIRHTYTTTGDSTVNFITTANPGTGRQAMEVTMRNMDIQGNNYYGAMAVYAADNNYFNVTFTYDNVVYTGSQANHILYGTIQYIDSTFNINRHEIAECGRVILGGKTTINHTMAGYSSLWLRYNLPDDDGVSSQYIRVLADAEVTLTSAYAPFYIADEARLIVEEGAKFTVSGATTCYNSNTFSRIDIGKNASLSCTQTTNGLHMLYLNGTMSVSPGASLHLTKTTGTNATLHCTNSTITITSPKSIVLDSSTGKALYLSGNTTLSLRAGQVNYWSQTPKPDDRGGLTDLPSYAWRKTILADQSQPETIINGTLATNSFTVENTNLTEEELAGKPLSLLQLNNAYVFSAGNLPLWVNPIADDGWPVFGNTEANATVHVSYTTEQEYNLTDRANDAGEFSVTTAEALPLTTPVTVKSNTPFLIQSVTTSVVPVGALELQLLPQEVAFDYTKKVWDSPPAYGRKVTAWDSFVTDSRARSKPWRLYAIPNRDLSSFDAQNQVKHTLPKALICLIETEDEIIARQLTTDTPTLIWEGTANGGDLGKVTAITWAENRGLLLGIGERPIFLNETYSAALSWLLETDD